MESVVGAVSAEKCLGYQAAAVIHPLFKGFGKSSVEIVREREVYQLIAVKALLRQSVGRDDITAIAGVVEHIEGAYDRIAVFIAASVGTVAEYLSGKGIDDCDVGFFRLGGEYCVLMLLKLSVYLRRHREPFRRCAVGVCKTPCGGFYPYPLRAILPEAEALYSP